MGIDGREGNQERERERRGKGGNEKVKEQVRQRESWRVVGLREVLHANLLILYRRVGDKNSTIKSVLSCIHGRVLSVGSCWYIVYTFFPNYRA